MATTERQQLTTRSAVRPRGLVTFRTGALFVSWIAATGALLWLIGAGASLNVTLATQREMCFVGLFVVELAAMYQFDAFRQRRRQTR